MGAQVNAGSTPIGAFYTGTAGRGVQGRLEGILGIRQLRFKATDGASWHDRAMARAVMVVIGFT